MLSVPVAGAEDADEPVSASALIESEAKLVVATKSLESAATASKSTVLAELDDNVLLTVFSTVPVSVT